MIVKAASSLLMEMVTCSTLESIGDLSERQLLEALHAEIQPARRNCALLPLGVLQTGVSAYGNQGGRNEFQRHGHHQFLAMLNGMVVVGPVYEKNGHRMKKSSNKHEEAAAA